MTILYRVLLTFNATSFILVVYAVKKEYTLGGLFAFAIQWPPVASYGVYFFIPILLTILSLLLARFLDRDPLTSSSQPNSIDAVELANNSFLPSYLGYFFVAVSVDQPMTMGFVYVILFLFSYFSQSLYFNPVFLMFRYNFFFVTTQGVRIFLITRKELKSPAKVELPELRRINNYTFIDMGGK